MPNTTLNEQEIEKQVEELLAKYGLTVTDCINLDISATRITTLLQALNGPKFRSYVELLHSDDFDIIGNIADQVHPSSTEPSETAFAFNLQLVSLILKFKNELSQLIQEHEASKPTQ